ncbi:MAG: Ig-like domain-containing protein [Clostridia bacterium]|nr:Ig-like domain-containing protein [Clostridia bacterium]
MRKLFSALAVVLVFAMAFTITASANTTTVFQPDEDGKYTVTYENTALKDAMVGMVVIEAAQDPETFAITEDDIRYIDQVDADSTGKISVGAFAPMAKETAANKYLVYVGGGTLTKAEKAGELNVPVTAESITLSGDESLEIGATTTLTATVTPAEATTSLTWTSSVESVATVDNTGKVTALAKGNTVITVTDSKSGESAEWGIEVVAPALTGVAVNKSTLSLVVEGKETLTVVPVPEKAEFTGVPAWTSAAPTIASVDPATGEVTAVAEGTANITVTVDGFSATCAVTVTAEPVGIPGDTDGTGELDVFDALRICQYLANWDVEINLDVADVDGSGELDVFDALRICQYLANWDVTLE